MINTKKLALFSKRLVKIYVTLNLKSIWPINIKFCTRLINNVFIQFTPENQKKFK